MGSDAVLVSVAGDLLGGLIVEGDLADALLDG